MSPERVVHEMKYIKDNFKPVDKRKILKFLVEMPIETWNIKGADLSNRHMGPTAQDFYKAFELSNDDKTIATVDADGVAFAAIQGLYEESQDL